MECPNCKKEIEDWRAECQYCNINFEDYEKGKEKFKERTKKTNADVLNIIAIINLCLSIVGALIIGIYYGVIEYDEMNWIGIITGIGVLLSGITLFFVLETIVDIYRKVEK